MKVIGFERVEGTSKDGRPYRGYKFHGTYESNRITGHGVTSEYISEKIIADNGGIVPDIGDELSVSFNRYGKVADYKITAGK